VHQPMLTMVHIPVPPAAIDRFLNDLVVALYRMARPAGRDHRLTVPVLSNPDTVHEVLGHPGQFPKSWGLLGAWGRSRFTTNGAEWQLRRALTQRAYVSAGSAQNGRAVRSIYEARLSDAEHSMAGIQRALLLAASEVFFSALGCTVDLEDLLSLFERARVHIKRLQFFTWHNPAASDSAAIRDGARDITQGFEAIVGRSPTIRQLIASFEAQAAEQADFDPYHELLMNVFAAIETTAATLCFAIDRLGLSAMAQNRLHDEDLQGGDAYLDCFINETLRYFPTVPFVVREAAEEVELDGIALRRGQTFVISIVGLHHDVRSWVEPEIFDSSRQEFLTNTFDRRMFLPFLAGPRMCGGARLAGLELRQGLRAFVRRFEVSNSSEDVGFDYGITLRPRHLGEMIFARRS